MPDKEKRCKGFVRIVLFTNLPVYGVSGAQFLIFSVCLFSQLMSSWKVAR